MSKIFDYLNWRGDLSQTACPFSEVDIACFTQLIYLDFNELLLDRNSSLTISQLFKKYESLNVIDKNVGLIISNKAKYMFISGVAKDITLENIQNTQNIKNKNLSPIVQVVFNKKSVSIRSIRVR